MKPFRKKIYAAAGYNTLFFGPGRPEFDPNQSMPTFESYLVETAKESCKKIPNPEFDEGVIGSFMSGKFLNQANLPGFLPLIVDSLKLKPCVAVEGACGTGGKAISTAVKSVLSDLSDATFVAGFEIQNRRKSVYGADVLAAAAYFSKERKEGHAYFFPNIFSERAGAYYEKYGYEKTREAMARWYEQSILNARKHPRAQEFYNKTENLFEAAMTDPNPKVFLPHLNYYDCSKISDGASSVAIFSEEGLKKAGLSKENAVEIVAIGEAQRDITKKPDDLTQFSITKKAVEKALTQAGISLNEIGLLEIHDCFTISAILALEAIGFAKPGQGVDFILEGNTGLNGKIPTNLSGGLIGYGHPTGATGVRQLVDLVDQFRQHAFNPASIHSPYGMMISMGGNDVTVTCIIVKK